MWGIPSDRLMLLTYTALGSAQAISFPAAPGRALQRLARAACNPIQRRLHPYVCACSSGEHRGDQR